MGAHPLFQKYMVLGPALVAIACEISAVVVGLASLAVDHSSETSGVLIGIAFYVGLIGACVLGFAVLTAASLPALRWDEVAATLVGVAAVIGAIVLGALVAMMLVPESP